MPNLQEFHRHRFWINVVFTRRPIHGQGEGSMKVKYGAGALAAALVLLIPAGGGAGAATAGGCKVAGTAHFTPGLKTAKTAGSYTFSGTLGACKNTADATATSGTVNASGSGPSVGCTGGNTSGTGTVNWNNGKTSTFSFTTTGAANVVKVTGKFTSGAFAGAALNSVLAFNATPTQCNSASGVTSAPFNGAAVV